MSSIALNLNELSAFIAEAKRNTYAVANEGAVPERKDFCELEYTKGELTYRDSYTGFYAAPGQEVVRFKGIPVWAMAYSGGMGKKHWGDEAFAKETFGFLKKALLQVPKEKPFRGPTQLKEGKWEYRNQIEGTLVDFKGTEQIFYEGNEVFLQHYIGGLIVDKKWFFTPSE